MMRSARKCELVGTVLATSRGKSGLVCAYDAAILGKYLSVPTSWSKLIYSHFKYLNDSHSVGKWSAEHIIFQTTVH